MEEPERTVSLSSFPTLTNLLLEQIIHLLQEDLVDLSGMQIAMELGVTLQVLPTVGLESVSMNMGIMPIRQSAEMGDQESQTTLYRCADREMEPHLQVRVIMHILPGLERLELVVLLAKIALLPTDIESRSIL